MRENYVSIRGREGGRELKGGKTMSYISVVHIQQEACCPGRWLGEQGLMESGGAHTQHSCDLQPLQLRQKQLAGGWGEEVLLENVHVCVDM